MHLLGCLFVSQPHCDATPDQMQLWIHGPTWFNACILAVGVGRPVGFLSAPSNVDDEENVILLVYFRLHYFVFPFEIIAIIFPLTLCIYFLHTSPHTHNGNCHTSGFYSGFHVVVVASKRLPGTWRKLKKNLDFKPSLLFSILYFLLFINEQAVDNKGNMFPIPKGYCYPSGNRIGNWISNGNDFCVCTVVSLSNNFTSTVQCINFHCQWDGSGNQEDGISVSR